MRSGFPHDMEIVEIAYVVLWMEGITMLLKKDNLIIGGALRAIKDVHFPVRIGICVSVGWNRPPRVA